MLFSKSRPFTLATGIIILLATALLAIGIANAHDAAGPIPAGFGDNTAAKDPTNQVGWDWISSGSSARVNLFMGSAWAEAGKVFGIEVFVDPATSTKPLLKDLRPTALPTGQVLSFDFPLSDKPLGATSKVGIHLLDNAGTAILISDGPRNTGLLTPPPTPTPTPPPPPTPVPTTEVPTAQITKVAAPTGGAAAIIQPSTAATVSAPDGTVVVAIPALAHDTTFQLVYNPSPAKVPSPAAGQKILRAFELNAHDSKGVQISLTLLKPASITIKYTAADVSAAPGKNPANLKIARYNPDTQAWTPLSTSLDLAAQMLTASTTSFSIYALMGVEPPPQTVATPAPVTPTPKPVTPTPTPTAKPPVTGDYTPGSGLLLGLVLLGFLLITAGGAYLAQTRRSRV